MISTGACSENIAGELRRHDSAARVTAFHRHALMIEAHKQLQTTAALFQLEHAARTSRASIGGMLLPLE